MVQDFALATEPVDNIVTNPPFALARQFVDHALELARRKIAMLFPIARLNAARWLEDVVPAALAAHPTAQHATG